eukprot:TRINITY_DN4411_c5_g1_i1.p1 TRINITY_DN4411_c5_g1~~TRINITY_DN4411_c5_g1_i1.p1  ORF type:complete len:203 (+),score=47.35 TRINITY_DN4411_c5_g1_i1:49-657(+)
MAVSTIKWLEKTTGWDISGTKGLEEYVRDSEAKHVSGRGNDGSVLAGDQILSFLETDLWKSEGVSRERLEAIDVLKTEYVNALNCIAFQEDQILLYLEELERARTLLRCNPSEEKRLKVVNIKLDITERLDKKHFKHKQKEAASTSLKQEITAIQLAQLNRSNFTTPPMAAATCTPKERTPLRRRKFDDTAVRAVLRRQDHE